MTRARSVPTILAAAAGTLAAVAFAAGLPGDADPRLRRQDFTSDPNWDCFRNRLLPAAPRMTRQDFGHRSSNHARGKEAGEIGGRVQRSLTPAYYAKAIPEKTLNEKLSMSGRVSVREDESNTGTLFGWFNADSRGWRTPNSLAIRLDGNGGKYWVFFEYGTRGWLTGGMGCFEGERYQETKTKPFRADGTPHTFTLTYDPDANDRNGVITFVLDDKTYALPLAPGHKLDGAMFNRFGVFNQQTSGGGMECYFDDVVLNGEPQDFSRDPKWEAKGNKAEFPERGIRPLHDFAFALTNIAAGKGKGELGGILWRDEDPAYYADRVGPLTLNDELFAGGRIAFTAAGSDSGVHIGWFDSASKKTEDGRKDRKPPRNMLSAFLEGPSRIGHYFRPAYSTSTGQLHLANEGPIVRPDGKPHGWSLRYAPKANNGNGRITVMLDGKAQSLDLGPGDKKAGATFDRFGLFNHPAGGNHVYVYFDDLTYTAKAGAER
jgi:hypothetical protein